MKLPVVVALVYVVTDPVEVDALPTATPPAWLPQLTLTLRIVDIYREGHGGECHQEEEMCRYLTCHDCRVYTGQLSLGDSLLNQEVCCVVS